MDTSKIRKRSSNPPLHIFLAIIFIALVLVLIFYANFQYAQNNPGGTDFLYRWMPTRLILFEGYKNPYSTEVSQQVQRYKYGGRLALKGEPPCLFAYPYYIIPIYIPFAAIENYATARAIWMTLLEGIHILIVLLTIRLFKIQLKVITIVFLLIFSLFFSYFTQPIIDGNPSPIAALLVLLSLIAISKQKDWLAGILLAFSTIKPQLVILFFILVWIWAFSHRRWKIILGSFFTLMVLFGVSFVIQPSWFIEFLKDVLLYPKVASPHSPITILNNWIPNASKWISLILTGFVVFILGMEWKKVYRQNFKYLFWASILTFTLSPLSGISSAHSNFIACLPGFVLLIAALELKANKKFLLIKSLPILLIIFSWSLFYLGRFAIIGGSLIYFVDFLILPILTTPALFWLRYHKNSIFQDSTKV